MILLDLLKIHLDIDINNICQISPIVFLINIILGFYCNYILYSILFICLFITSIFYHTYNTDFTYIIDKVSILYVILYGTMLFFQKINDTNTNIHTITNTNNVTFISRFIYILMSIMIVLTFISVIYLYYYGYCYNIYCFNQNIDIAYWYQSLIHFISCFSHILIMIL